MKINEFKKNTTYLLLVTLLYSTSTFAQFICDIDNRNWFYKTEGIGKAEFSGLAYHPQLNLLFTPLDTPVCPLTCPNEGEESICPLPEGLEEEIVCLKNSDGEDCPNPSPLSIHMRGYNLKENNAFDVRFSDKDELLTGCDFEGMTHLKDDYFALLEEDESKIYFLKYKPNDQQFEVLHAHNTGIELTVFSNFTLGLGGITYNPNTGRLYVIDEYERKLYGAPIVLPGEILPNGGISTEIIVEKEFADSSANLGDDNIPPTPYHLATGLFHLGQIYPANHPLANNILVTSFITPPTRAITLIEFKISLDQNNDLSLDLLKEVDFDDIKTANDEVEPKPEGIVVTENTIYVTSELKGLSSYPKKINSCDDGNNIFDQDCACVEKPVCNAEITIQENVDDESYLQTLYESSESIDTKVTTSTEVDVIIRKNEVVDLKSNQITLNAGFEVEKGACLNAIIEPCE